MTNLATPRRWGLLVSLLLTLALLVAACGGGTSQPTPAAEAQPTEAPEPEPTATEIPEEQAEPTATAVAEEPEPTATAVAEEPEPTATAVAEEPVATGTPVAEEESAAPVITGDPANGQYIATLTGGCGCHFNRDLGALAGGNRFEGPYGAVYASNITPHVETGIGSYTEDDIIQLLHTGARPDGSQLAPSMPYAAFSALNLKDSRDLAAYLLSLEAVENQVAAPELTGEIAAFAPATEPAAEPSADPVERGAELVAIARCSGCHTPRLEDGSVDMDKFLAGAPIRDAIASNITPDVETGIGSWSQEEIATLMRTGARPDGSQVEGAMAQQIERRFGQLTENDALAIAAYLLSIPAVNNDPSAP